jgi:iron complex transport system ATP-binding protein
MTVIRTVAHSGPRTVVCVLHDLTLAARFADHIIVIDDGRVAAAGAPKEVITEQLLRDVFGLQAHVININGAPAVIPSRHT